jgi:hypothetical protein
LTMEKIAFVESQCINPYAMRRIRDSDYLIKVSSQDFIANRSMIMDMVSGLLTTIYMRLRILAKLFPK